MRTATSSEDRRQDAAMTSRKGADVSIVPAEKRSTCGNWIRAKRRGGEGGGEERRGEES